MYDHFANDYVMVSIIILSSQWYAVMLKSNNTHTDKSIAHGQLTQKHFIKNILLKKPV